MTKTKIVTTAQPLSGLKAHVANGVAAVGQEGIELASGLLVLIMVERGYGPPGLGIFAYLMACMFTLRYLSTMGMVRYVEVETARQDGEAARQQLFAGGTLAVLLTALAVALLLLLTSAFNASQTRVEERFLAYVIMALILPVANVNSLKLAILNGLGRHTQVAWLRITRHGAILVLIYFLTGTRLIPSLLLVAYLFAEMILALRLRRHLRLPKLRALTGNFAEMKRTFQQSSTYLLTDNGFDLLLNIDFFLLGLFVGAVKLGTYAEAAVLVRCSLVFTIALRPLLRRYYTRKESEQPAALPAIVGRHSAVIFTVQGLLALITLLYYPLVLDLFFEARRQMPQSLEIFMVFVPGLIFYSTFLAVEPIYEALRRPDELRQLTFTVVATNVILTGLLVPAAGVFGAATATMLTMLAHFFLFGRRLPLRLKPGKSIFLSGAIALYLVYSLLSNISDHPVLYFWLGPLLLLAAYYGCGLFGVEGDADEKAAAEPVIFELVDDN